MKTIWKYKLNEGVNCIWMPKGAEILTVSARTGEPCLWALVDAKDEKINRFFLVMGTGWKIPDWPSMSGSYKGTFFIASGSRELLAGLPMTLVYHVFELPSENVAATIARSLDQQISGKKDSEVV